MIVTDFRYWGVPQFYGSIPLGSLNEACTICGQVFGS